MSRRLVCRSFASRTRVSAGIDLGRPCLVSGERQTLLETLDMLVTSCLLTGALGRGSCFVAKLLEVVGHVGLRAAARCSVKLRQGLCLS